MCRRDSRARRVSLVLMCLISASTVIPFDLQQFVQYRAAFWVSLIMPVDILAWKVEWDFRITFHSQLCWFETSHSLLPSCKYKDHVSALMKDKECTTPWASVEGAAGSAFLSELSRSNNNISYTYICILPMTRIFRSNLGWRRFTGPENLSFILLWYTVELLC